MAVLQGAVSKSFALLLEGLRHVNVEGFRAIYFRRTSPELRAPGGLWDTSRGLYPFVGGKPREQELEWIFPSGARIKFSHLEHESDRFAHQGAQYAVVAWDEVNHFSAAQFWYLLSRARSTCGVKPYVRATCNPDPDSWVAEFISWWIDQEAGTAIPERVGVLRWFTRVNNELLWADSREEAIELAVSKGMKADLASRAALSATFVSASLADNPALLKADPGYEAKLAALSRVDRARLLEGNWLVREAAGEMFKASFFPILETAPASVRRVRFWDLAASKKARSDHTAGVLFSIDAQGLYCVEDVKEVHLRPHGTEEVIRQTAEDDGVGTEVWIEQETGAGAEFVIDQYQRHVLKGYSVYGLVVRGLGSKVERAKPVSSAAEKQHIRIVRGAWNRQLLAQLESFGPVPSPGMKDDQVDAMSGAFHALQSSGFAVGTASW